MLWRWCAGGLFFIHIARLLRLWGNKSLNTLWRALLLNRGVTTAAQAADSTRPVSTSDLLAELKALVPGGSSDFEQAFNDYVCVYCCGRMVVLATVNALTCRTPVVVPASGPSASLFTTSMTMTCCR